MKMPIYMDSHATTCMDPRVFEAMKPYFMDVFGNAASRNHSFGWEAEEAVEKSRKQIADLIGATAKEIVFTSGATESNNLALKGVAEMYAERGNHIITQVIEHKAVLDTCKRLEKDGIRVTYLPVKQDGLIDLDQLRDAITDKTILISIMYANNEIGVVQPMKEIGKIAKEKGVLFHTDAVQAIGKIPVNVAEDGIDLLSLTGHKLYGPKGVGALYVRRGTPLARFMEGGGQERGRRGGTLNVPGIVGLGRATELAHAQMASETARLTELRDWFFERLTATISGVRICGPRMHRMPNNIHFCLDGVQGEPVLLALDAAGICASAGSACSAGSTEPSHVLKAICVPREQARGALRLTMGGSTDQAALEYTLETLSRTVSELRLLSGSTERH